MRICPNCKERIIANDIDECPYCHSPLYFTIGEFFGVNASLFAVIGFIGTMLALLPNLAEHFYGDFSTIPQLQVYLLIFTLIFGVFFLVLVSVVIISRMQWKTRVQERAWSTWTLLKVGDWDRLIFLGFFIPFIGSIFYFIAFLFTLITQVVFSIFMIYIFALMSLAVFTSIRYSIIPIKWKILFSLAVSTIFIVVVISVQLYGIPFVGIPPPKHSPVQQYVKDMKMILNYIINKTYIY